MNWKQAGQVVRGEPYRVFFPLAAVLGGVGVGHWFAYHVGLVHGVQPLGHALLQVEAFLMAFACGFLGTLLPRRSGLPPATFPELALLAAGLIALSATAMSGRFVASQVIFVGVIAVLGQFAVRRLRRAASPRRPPDAFVLVPLGIAAGLGGALVLLFGLVAQRQGAVLAGRGLLFGAMFSCLVLGIGHMLMPLLAGFPVPPDGTDAPSSRRRRLGHAITGLLIIGSVPLERMLAGTDEVLASRVAHLLRGGAFAVDWAACVRGWRWPVAPGLHRRVAWLAFWLVPLGELLAAADPAHGVGFLHVSFIGGLALLSFAVATHVIAAHSGSSDIVSGSPWQVKAFAAIFLASMLTRVFANFLPGNAYWSHLAWASLLWLVGLVVWGAWILPRVARLPAEEQESARELPVIRQP